MAKQQTPAYLLCLDWETSGADFGKDSSVRYQGLSFGAIVADASTFEPVEELYVEVKFDPKYEWTDGAEKVNWLTREHLEESGVSQEDAAIKLAELILKYWGPTAKVMFMGHNCIFDQRFTKQLMATIDIEFSSERTTDLEGWIQLHHVILDTSALGFLAFGIFRSNDLFEHIGYDARGAHNALDDARMTLGTAKAIKQLVQEGLNG